MKKLILVRPEQSGAMFEELCKSLETALASRSDWTYELKIGKAGGCATCTKAAQLASGNTVAYLWTDGVVAVAAQSDLLLRLGVQRLLSGVQAVQKAGETLWDATAYVRDGWLQNFPAYTDGELDPSSIPTEPDSMRTRFAEIFTLCATPHARRLTHTSQAWWHLATV